MKALLALSCSIVALASTSDRATAQVTAPQSSGGGIEEIVVTAQRREESQQDVPIAISAVSGSALQQANISSLPEVAKLVPNLQFQAIGAYSVPFLRGVGAPTTVVGAESATSLYIDGVYVGNQSASLLSLPSVASVEVLKGPQGTLFGRNATGGVIQVRTRRPQQDTTGALRFEYGNFDTVRASAYYSTGITPELAFDVTGYVSDQGEGWGTNLYDGSDVYKESDRLIRSRVLWTPTERTEINLVASYERIKSDIGYATRLLRPGELGQNERSLVSGLQFNGGFRDVSLDFASGTVNNIFMVSGDWQQDFDFARFRSITSYQKFHGPQSVDFDLTSNFNAHVRYDMHDRVITQEFQLLSPDDSDLALSWIVGAYYFNGKGGYDNFTQTGLFSTLPPATATTPTQPVYLDSTQWSRSYAGFGEVAIKLFGDSTKLTLGGRYTKDKRRVSITRFNNAVGAPAAANFSQAGEDTFNKFTYRVNLAHNFTDDVLVYGQVSRGFKSGFFNSQTFQRPGQSVATPVGPETIDAYEIGLKSDFFDRKVRFNLAGFYYNYDDLQVNAFIDATTRITINAAAARIKGIEAQLTVVPLDGLTLDFSGGYLDAKYKSFPGGPSFTPRPGPPWGLAAVSTDLSGRRLTNAPEFSGTASATYRVPVGDGSVAFSGSAYYNDGYFFDPQNRLFQRSYTLLSGSVTWKSANGLSVGFWGNNLTNRNILASVNATAGGDSATVRAPRTYGVRIGFEY